MFAVYQKDSGMFTLIPFSSSERAKTAKASLSLNRTMSHMRSFKLKLCRRRHSASIDRRFWFPFPSPLEGGRSRGWATLGSFDLVTERESETYTLQALSEEDLRQWLGALNALEPVPHSPCPFPSCAQWQPGAPGVHGGEQWAGVGERERGSVGGADAGRDGLPLRRQVHRLR